MSKSWVYVIVADVSSLPVVQTRSGCPFKVGISQNPRARLAQLQTGSPFKLSVEIGDLHFADPRAAEREIHRRLSHLYIGGEWFWGDSDIAYEMAVDVMSEEGDRAFEEYKRSLA